MDWIARINEQLDALGLYPDVEACAVTDVAGHLVLVDTQEATVYHNAEGVSRLLSQVERADDDHETFDAVGQALHPNVVEDMPVIEDNGLWRRDPQATTDEN